MDFQEFFSQQWEGMALRMSARENGGGADRSYEPSSFSLKPRSSVAGTTGSTAAVLALIVSLRTGSRPLLDLNWRWPMAWHGREASIVCEL